MNKKIWFFLLLAYLLSTSLILYLLYRSAHYARPWAIGFESLWFLLCGIYFWKMVRRKAGSFAISARAFIAAWAVLLAAYAVSIAASIAWQLYMIKYYPPEDAWDGILAGYAQLHVFEGYALSYKIDPLLQLTATGELKTELGLVLIVSLLALVFVKRQQIMDDNFVNRRKNAKR